jgi:hypothetical protein
MSSYSWEEARLTLQSIFMGSGTSDVDLMKTSVLKAIKTGDNGGPKLKHYEYAMRIMNEDPYTRTQVCLLALSMVNFYKDSVRAIRIIIFLIQMFGSKNGIKTTNDNDIPTQCYDTAISILDQIQHHWCTDQGRRDWEEIQATVHPQSQSQAPTLTLTSDGIDIETSQYNHNHNHNHNYNQWNNKEVRSVFSSIINYTKSKIKLLRVYPYLRNAFSATATAATAATATTATTTTTTTTTTTISSDSTKTTTTTSNTSSDDVVKKLSMCLTVMSSLLLSIPTTSIETIDFSTRERQSILASVQPLLKDISTLLLMNTNFLTICVNGNGTDDSVPRSVVNALIDQYSDQYTNMRELTILVHQRPVNILKDSLPVTHKFQVTATATATAVPSTRSETFDPFAESSAIANTTTTGTTTGTNVVKNPPTKPSRPTSSSTSNSTSPPSFL